MAKQKNQQNYTALKQHKQFGKTLIPPAANIPNLQLTSWKNDRLPELLWASLIVASFPQSQALSSFRRVIEYVFKHREDKDNVHDVRHSHLQKIRPEILNNFLAHLTGLAEVKEALRPLLLLTD